jgi:hypothetical protein
MLMKSPLLASLCLTSTLVFATGKMPGPAECQKSVTVHRGKYQGYVFKGARGAIHISLEETPQLSDQERFELETDLLRQHEYLRALPGSADVSFEGNIFETVPVYTVRFNMSFGRKPNLGGLSGLQKAPLATRKEAERLANLLFRSLQFAYEHVIGADQMKSLIIRQDGFIELPEIPDPRQSAPW